MSRSWRWPVAAFVAAALLAGCGESHHRDGTRPAAPLTVTARIGTNGVQVSPRKVGAGPLVFIVSNQSGRSQRLTFQTDETGGGPAGMKASTAVPLGGTAQLQVNPGSGSYVLGVRDRTVKPASIKVGAKRPSAQNALLEP